MREFTFAILTYLVTIAIAAAAGVGGAVWYVRHQQRVPDLVVLDMRRLIEPLANDGELSDTERKKRIQRLSEIATRTIDAYAARGAIVLDGSAVLRAPRRVYVGP